MSTQADEPGLSTDAPGPAEESTLRVVVVEDDREYAWLVEEMLRDAFPGRGIEVAHFATLGELATSPGTADCALVDMSLPDGQGMEVLDRVQEAYPAVPLVVLTGAEDEEQALQAVERGAQDYLVKRKVAPDPLGRSIRYAMERGRAERQRAELLHARAAHAEAEALSGTLSRLQDVADAAMAQGGLVDHDELLERSLAVIAAESGMLVLRDENNQKLTVAACRGLPSVAVHEPLELAEALESAFGAGEPVVLGDISEADAGTLGAGTRVKSLVAVPLEAEGRRLGSLVATSTLADRFSDEQARLLALAAERGARGLANADAYERERRTSAALQTGLLPQGAPDLPHGEIAVRYLPARGGPAVGGDWYDAIELPDGRLGLAIGDATGHGAEAAVLMGQMRTALRAYALEGISPAVVAERLNALALSLGEAAISTFVYVLLEASLTEGTYVNAGHPPPVVVSRDGATPLALVGSTPAGASPTPEIQEVPLTLAPGDALCLYSDGLVEERSVDRSVREQLLLDALGRPAGAEILCERALAALRPNGASEDDVALLVLRTSATTEGLKTTHPATADALRESRAALREWLTAVGASAEESGDILMATNEACMNVVEHAYAARPGEFTLEGHLDGQTVVLIVRDAGRWSEVRARGQGRGLKLMEALMESVQLSFSAEGTIVVLRKTLGQAA